MEYKSNITVASNIYSRINADVKNDPNFVANVWDGVALRELDKRLYGMESVKLNADQREQLRESVTCTFRYNYLQEMTHGPVKTEYGVTWQCRCENINCESYSRCMPIPLIRKNPNIVETDEITESSPLEFEWIGAIKQLFIKPDISEEFMEMEEEPVPNEFAKAPENLSEAFSELEEPVFIIEASINSHILVNAGPGTGKTYTVIERLTYIINSGMVDLGQVLVLCYTNAARDVILNRLDEKGLSVEARQLVICTLDSLAWSNLSEKTEDDLFSLGYNGCIQRFNTEFDDEEWSDFQYIIIDELQDLVNERAQMTINILKAVQCGYLLLGDKCQAIYDYDCNGTESISSVAFYDKLNAMLPDDAVRYELIGNKRQSAELSRRSNDFREALLCFNTQDANEFFDHEINSMPKSIFLADSFSCLNNNGTTAILTRNNGEAEWVSALLHKASIRHNLMRSVSPRLSFNRWIADVFWDYHEPHISRNDFIERYTIRLNSDEASAISTYETIISSLSSGRAANIDYFDLREFIQELKKGRNLAPLFTNNPCEELTVSTVHKAKGREFDHVYLISRFSPSNENTEEARIWYVGSTRPKSRLDPLSHLPIYVGKPTPMNRRMIIGYKHGRYGDSAIKYCSNIVVGLPYDVDNYSFVEGDLYQALNIQRYLADSIKINDTVELLKADNLYKIIHNGLHIGSLNTDVTGDFWSAINKTDNRNNIPSHLTDIYINNIITVIPNKFPSGIHPMFKESKCWLGVELTGFPKVNWHYGGN